MANFDTLKATIAARIHDNNEQEITAQDVRDSFTDTIDAINAAKEDTGGAGMDIHGLTAENTIADADEFPFYDASAAGNRKTVWSNIRAKLKNAFDSIYAGAASTQTALDGKAAKVSGATAGDLAGLDASGNLTDSGKKPSDFATAAQGAKADTAYQKPSSGIPSSDLASPILASLGKANSAVQPGDLNDVAYTGKYSDLTGTPTIPAAPGTLNTDNASAQTVSSSEALSGTVKLHKVSKTGDYGDLLNTPTIPAAQVQADWNEADSDAVDYIKNKPTIPAAPGTLDTDNTGAQAVSSNEALSGTVKLHKVSKTGSYAHLNNKPTIPSISLNGSTTTSPSFYAPTGAGTVGQVLTSNGSGAPTWQNAPSGGVQDVTLGGTSVVSGGVAVLPAYPSVPVTDVTVGGTSVVSSGVAAVPAIPAAPGTLDTTATTAQATNASEALSGSVKLHKVAKTGTYSDLIGTPTIPAAQVNSDWNAGSGVAQILNKPSLATVATSGSYADLTNKPTIDATPTNASTNAVQSGGVYTELVARPKYYLCADEAEYTSISPKDSATLYLIPES